MKKLLQLSLLFILSTSFVKGQFFYGEDILRFSNYSEVGTARAQGMGGALTALGGDASSAILNPAGLGFYNRNEFSISPNFTNVSNSSLYINNSTTTNPTNFAIGQAAAVFSRVGTGSRKKRSVFALSYNTLINFYNEYEYSGTNNVSSVQDLYAQIVNESGASIADLESEFNPTTGIADTQEALYFQSFMIEPTDQGFVVFEPALPVRQQGRVKENGSLGQFSLSLANNFDDKLYVGATLGIQNLNYTQVDYIDEAFENPEFLNGLRSTNELTIQGTGINLNLGSIYRLSDDFTVGLNLVTPTLMGVRETIVRTISIDGVGDQVPTEWPTVQQAPSDYRYRYNGPFRANLGTAYYLPSKLGVLSAQLGYVSYGRMKFKDRESDVFTSEQQSFIDRSFNDAVNLSIGGELRFGITRVRAGFNHLGDPLNTDNLNRSQQALSLGAGLRGKRFFGDLAFRSVSMNSSYTPYALPNPADFDSVLIEGRINSLSLTIGALF